MIINKKTLGFIIISLILCVNLASSQISVFSNTTVTACSDNFGTTWGTIFSRTVTTSGLPTGGLSAANGIVLREVRVRLGNSGCKGNLSSYSLSIVNPQGVRVILANQLMTTSTGSWVDMKFRDDIALERIKEYSTLVQNSYVPHSIGYYAIETDGQFANFNTGADPNGNWQFQVIENTLSEVSFEKVELVFGPPICVIDYTGDTGNNFCSGASCIANGVFRATNNGYSIGDPQFPGEGVSGCIWNTANNNSAWFRFVPTSTTARITLSGIIINGTVTASSDTQPIIVKGNGSCLTPTLVPTGGCPDDQPINNMAYSSSNAAPNAGGISTSGIYFNGISDNCEFNLSGLTIGDPYYLYVDGESGKSSTFYIEVENGVDNLCPSSCCLININGPSSICAGSSAITFTQSGGVAGGTWSVSPLSAGTINSSGVFTPTASTTSSISATISYNTGACSGTVSLVIKPIPSSLPTSQTNPNCGGSDGTVTITPDPAGVYTYTWSSPAVSTTNTATNLQAGTYTITVGQGGCTTNTVVTLISSGAPTITAVQITSPSCANNDGSATIISTAADSYTWSSGVITYTTNTATESNLTPGDYTITVGLAGCNSPTVINIPATITPTILSTQTQDATCNPASGSATITTNPATGVTFTWTPPAISSTSEASELTVGDYTVIVDIGGCSTQTIITINSNSVALTSTLSVIDNTVCAGSSSDCSGSAEVVMTSGTAPYTYTWNDPLSQTTATSYSLCSGTYSVVVTDANSCTQTITVSITSPTQPTITSVTSNSATCGLSNASATVSANPSSVTYTWTDSGGSTLSNTSMLSNVTKGTYTVTVENAPCSTSSVIVVDGSDLDINFTATTTPSSCENNDGVLLITNSFGVAEPFLYSINGASPTVDTVFQGLSSGIYTITIQDSYNCSITQTYTVSGTDTKPDIIVPNVFTPNNDTKNDFWFATPICIKDYKLTIYNRWGSKLIEISNPNDKWDGNGANDGTYYYVLEAKGYNNEEIKKTGYITITR